MIKLLTADRINDYFEFCENSIIGAVLSVRLKAYGLCSQAMFWYSENDDGSLNSALGLSDGVFSVETTMDAPFEEIGVFASVVGADTVVCSDRVYEKIKIKAIEIKNSKVFIFDGKFVEISCESITGENLSDTYNVISDGNNIDFDCWYTDVSHKIRHGLIRGQGVFKNGQCVSAAFTSGETDKIAVISSVATKSEERQKGYGKDVVMSLVNELRDKTVYLLTDSDETAYWYEKMGFSVTDDFLFEVKI